MLCLGRCLTGVVSDAVCKIEWDGHSKVCCEPSVIAAAECFTEVVLFLTSKCVMALKAIFTHINSTYLAVCVIDSVMPWLHVK